MVCRCVWVVAGRGAEAELGASNVLVNCPDKLYSTSNLPSKQTPVRQTPAEQRG